MCTLSYRMGIIYEIANTRVSKAKSQLYRLSIINQNAVFWIVFPWEFLDIIKSKEEGNKVIVTFRAQSVQTLKEFVAKKKDRIYYDDAQQLFLSLKNQLESLEKQGMSIASFAMEDIIVVNDRIFLCINQDKAVTKDKDGKLEIIQPIKKGPFCGPEFCNISLPAHLPHQTSFFSLAALTTFCLTNDAQKDYEKALESIWQTPLYWALMRCLHKNPKERYLLMI